MKRHDDAGVTEEDNRRRRSKALESFGQRKAKGEEKGKRSKKRHKDTGQHE